MESDRHHTHILSSSSEEDQNNKGKTSYELMLSRQKEVENPKINGLRKINIKDLFKNIEDREKNKIIYLDENEEGTEEEKNVDEDIINYYKEMNKKKDKRKNITQNLKDCLVKKRQAQLINSQDFDLITNNNNNDNENNNKNEEKKDENNINENEEKENGASKKEEDEEEEEESDELNDETKKKKKKKKRKKAESVNGNSENKNNDKNNRDIANTNRENKLTETNNVNNESIEEQVTNKNNNEEQINNRNEKNELNEEQTTNKNAKEESNEEEENEGNKESNLNENNEKNDNSMDNNLNNEEVENKEIINKNINDTNFFESEIIENKKPNYEKSNFNFCLINKNEKEDKKEQESSEDSKDIKELIEQKIESEDDNNFNSSEDNDSLEEDVNYDNRKGKKIEDKNNNIKMKKSVNTKGRDKKLFENNKKQKVINNKYIKDKNMSNSNNKYNNKYKTNNNYNNNNKSIRARTRENEKSQQNKLKNQITEKNTKSKTNSKSIKKNPNKKEIVKIRNMNIQTNKIKTTGNISTKNREKRLINIVSPRNISNITKREIRLYIPRKCYFTKTIIQMDNEEYNLLNEKIAKEKEKNKIFRHKRNNNNTFGINNNYGGINLYDEINNRKYFDFDYEDNNTQNYINNIDDIPKENNQRTFLDRGELNNYMDHRLISPNILINRNINQNRNKYQKKLTDVPLSPYLLNKYNFMQKPLNKSNSAMNIFNNSNKKINKKFPNISNNHNSLKSGNSNQYISNLQNEPNLNFFKTNPIFNFNPKNNVFIPVIKNRQIQGIQSANLPNLHNYNFKNIEISTPISVDIPNRITLDMKNFHKSKQIHPGDKGYGRHFGNEKDCPICQSVFMKSNYNMKNMHHYNDFIKQRDKNTIKLNKQQFLQELKKPSTRSQKMEADIMKEIKQFINYSKKIESIENNDQDDASIINAYFGL